MIAEKTYKINVNEEAVSFYRLFASRLSDYSMLMKFRLSTMVVFSSAIGYMMGSVNYINWIQVLWLSLGGFLITGSSNTINQILEKDTDRLMSRTANRPLATDRMSVTEAWVITLILGLSGIAILWFMLNPLSAFIGTLSLLLYSFVYTPLKRLSPIAVFVGAIPGALPPLIGWVAATGTLGLEGFILFSIQFIWQFPHFWAIAWVLDEDYKKAGFKLLPSKEGRSKFSAFQNIFYILMLIPISLLPAKIGMTGLYSSPVIIICGLLFLWQAVNLFREVTVKAASQLMFGSFLYLPVIQLALVIDKI